MFCPVALAKQFSSLVIVLFRRFRHQKGNGLNWNQFIRSCWDQVVVMWTNAPNYFMLAKLMQFKPSHLFHVICTTSFSMSSARPFSRGSAIIVILFLEFGTESEQKCVKHKQKCR